MPPDPKPRGRPSQFWNSYTSDVTREDLQRLTRDARDAWRFYRRGLEADDLKAMPWHRRGPAYRRSTRADHGSGQG